jgi:hypothetical protein
LLNYTRNALEKTLVGYPTLADQVVEPLPGCDAETPDWDMYGAIQLKEIYESALKSANSIRRKIATDLQMDKPLPMGTKNFLALLLHRQVDEPRKPSNRPPVQHRDLLLKAISRGYQLCYRTCGAGNGIPTSCRCLPRFKAWRQVMLEENAEVSGMTFNSTQIDPAVLARELGGQWIATMGSLHAPFAR